MVSNRNKTISWLLSMLAAAALVAACSPDGAIEENPTSILTPTHTDGSEATPSRPDPTATSLAPTNTPPPTTIVNSREAVVVLCDDSSDSPNLRSTPSQQEGLSRDIDSLIPPAPPARVSFSQLQESVELTWPGTGTDVDQSYNIYQLSRGEECWKLIGVQPVEGQNQELYTFNVLVADQQGGDMYAVTTVDIYSNESEFSIGNEQEP